MAALRKNNSSGNKAMQEFPEGGANAGDEREGTELASPACRRIRQHPSRLREETPATLRGATVRGSSQDCKQKRGTSNAREDRRETRSRPPDVPSGNPQACWSEHLRWNRGSASSVHVNQRFSSISIQFYTGKPINCTLFFSLDYNLAKTKKLVFLSCFHAPPSPAHKRHLHP